jgi:hypothetical protein
MCKTSRIIFRVAILAASLYAAFAASPATAPGEETIDLGYRQMYDLDFGAAHRTFGEWNQKHPADPLGHVSDAAAYLFGEFDRMRVLQSEFFVHDETFTKPKALTPDPAAKQAFLKELEIGERLAQDALKQSGDRDFNAMFAWVLTFGLRADYDGLIEKHYFSSISYMKTGRIAAEKLLSLDPTCHDAYVAMGVEAYVLGSKPMPVRWILRMAGSNTDREDGIRKVRFAAEDGRYLRPFARLLLAVAALRDNDVRTATSILDDLSKQFPHNRLYAEELARLRKTK